MNSPISQQKLTIATDAEMQQFGSRLAKAMQAGVVVYLYGQLGAGKTTMVRGFLRGLDYNGKVKSPTYTLVEPYETPLFHVYHFDLYRINHPSELTHIGIDDYFAKDAVCLIEWPDKAQLPAPDLACYIEILAASDRQVTLQAMTKSGDDVLARL